MSIIPSLTAEILSQDLHWYYNFKYGKVVNAPESGVLVEYLQQRYSADGLDAAFLSLIVMDEWLLTNLRLLSRGKWLGQGWIGPDLVAALCECTLALPVFDLMDVMQMEPEKILTVARHKLVRKEM